MALDVQPITGTNAKVAARLCNFKTGFADLLVSHKTWLDANVLPAVQSIQGPWIDLIGYASRIGNTQANKALSQRRCDTVRSYVATYGSNLNFPTDVGLGPTGPDANDNDGYYRAVEVYVYGFKPPPQPNVIRVPLPKPRALGTSDFQIRFLFGVSAGNFGVQGDAMFFEIVEGEAKRSARFAYAGAGLAVPVPKLNEGGLSKAGAFEAFKTSTPVFLSTFVGEAGAASPPGVTFGSSSVNSKVTLHFMSDNLKRLGAKVSHSGEPSNQVTMGTGSGIGVTLGSATAGVLRMLS